MAAAFVVAAPFLGSFFALLVDRLPREEPTILGRSRCTACNHPLAVRDLVPISSWLLLRGKCRYCGAPIGADPILIELFALASALGIAVSLPMVWWGQSLLMVLMLLSLSLIDLRHFIIPDRLSLGLLLLGLGSHALLNEAHLLDHLIGAFVGYGFLWGISEAYLRLRGRDGLGLGDAKLLAAGGAWVGWQGLPSILLWGSMSGLVFALALSLTGRSVNRETVLAFGPFLAFGIAVTWFFGPLGA